MTYRQAKKDFEILALYVKDVENNCKSVEWLPDDAEGKIAVTAEHWIGVKSQPLLCFVADITSKVDQATDSNIKEKKDA